MVILQSSLPALSLPPSNGLKTSTKETQVPSQSPWSRSAQSRTEDHQCSKKEPPALRKVPTSEWTVIAEGLQSNQVMDLSADTLLSSATRRSSSSFSTPVSMELLRCQVHPPKPLPTSAMKSLPSMRMNAISSPKTKH